jgi:two-component system, OmpR family, osmolarity sensor histidine kinase EnvZ
MASPKSLLPRSLFGRALTILLVPIVVLQLVVGLVFFQRHYLRVSEQMTRGIAYGLSYAADRAEALGSPQAALAAVEALGLPFDLRLDIAPAEAFEAGTERGPLDFTGAKVIATLQSTMHRPLRIDLLSDSRMAIIGIRTDAGILEAVVPRDRLSVSNPHQLLVLMIVVALILTAVAIVFLRNQVRPIRTLAEAAEAFGKGRSLPYRPAGAEEVRRAGVAFVSMRTRLERQIEQRTQMLSGVSHDLRTPLTRMKLTLELMDETEDTRDLRQDVDQMERMLDAFLAFARGDGLEETVATDPFALVADIAEDARRAGAEISLVAFDETDRTAARPILVPLRPGAVARAVQNLVGNAAAHGQTVHLTVRLGPRALVFVVEDDGPGIPEADRTRALQPFTRLDKARRSNAAGSVGLGLSIALDVARSHGGSLDLGESAELGGLKAILRIPR